MRLSQECKTELTSKNQKEYTIFIRKKIIFSKDTETALDKILQPFMIKKIFFNKLEIKGNFLNLMKTIYLQLTYNIILKWLITECCLPKIMYVLAVLIQIVLEVYPGQLGKEKNNKRHPDWKEVQAAGGMILYIENPNKSTKKLLELMNIYIRTNIQNQSCYY